MSRLPALKYQDVVACRRRRGFEDLRPGKGGHEFWINRQTGKVTMVGCHPGDIARGTMRAIIAQTELTAEEFRKCPRFASWQLSRGEVLGTRSGRAGGDAG